MKDFSNYTFDELSEVFCRYISAFTDYVEKNGKNSFVYYDNDNELLYFNDCGKWYNENEVELGALAIIADKLGIKVDLDLFN